MLEGEGQADSVEAELPQAPDDGRKVLTEAVIALGQVARRCETGVESKPAGTIAATTSFVSSECTGHAVSAGSA